MDNSDGLIRGGSGSPGAPGNPGVLTVAEGFTATGGELTDRQRSCLNSLVYRYRRQIPAPIVAKATLRLADEQAAYRLDVFMPPATIQVDRSSTSIRNPLDGLFVRSP